MSENVHSIEEIVEDHFKRELNEYGAKYYTKTESINSNIEIALKEYPSKTGGVVGGGNIPDIKMMLRNNGREIPVMIEAKGTAGALLKCTLGKVDLDQNAISEYALNGAIHYANAIINNSAYDTVLAIGINGKHGSFGEPIFETFSCIVSKKNNNEPIRLLKTNHLTYLHPEKQSELIKIIDEIVEMFCVAQTTSTC